jgi:acylphosphatase
MPMPSDQRLEAIVYGVVQGVFFRHHTRLEATRLGLAGTVRNRPDGSVGVIAEGPRGQLDGLLSWLHRGPGLAEVERVEVEWKDATGGCSDFRIVR